MVLKCGIKLLEEQMLIGPILSSRLRMVDIYSQEKRCHLVRVMEIFGWLKLMLMVIKCGIRHLEEYIKNWLCLFSRLRMVGTLSQVLHAHLLQWILMFGWLKLMLMVIKCGIWPMEVHLVNVVILFSRPLMVGILSQDILIHLVLVRKMFGWLKPISMVMKYGTEHLEGQITREVGLFGRLVMVGILSMDIQIHLVQVMKIFGWLKLMLMVIKCGIRHLEILLEIVGILLSKLLIKDTLSWGVRSHMLLVIMMFG